MRQNGLDVKDVKNIAIWMRIRKEYKIPQDFQSCHTGIVDGYFLEGHIPADDVRRLLNEKPADVVGLSVQGMPMGSPGMDYGTRKEPYVVYFFKKDGSVGVWARH